MKKMLLLAVLCLLAATVFADKNEPRIRLLGERSVDFNFDKDEITPSHQEYRYSKLMFVVEENDLHIYKLIVIYGNGEKDEIQVKHYFKEGDRSRILDLEGKERQIKKITFYYKTVGNKREGRAHVKVFGLNADLLGTRTVDFKADRDEIEVGKKEGKFAKLLLEVDRNDVNIYKLIVIYGNGEKDDIQTKTHFEEGNLSHLLDIKGDERTIKKIIFYYKTTGPHKEGKAIIRVFGL